MATILNVTENNALSGVNTSSFTGSIGTHVSGNLLLACFSMDGASTSPIGFGTSGVTVTNNGGGARFAYTGSDIWTNGDEVELYGTTAPGGFSFGTRYFVRDVDTVNNYFWLETSVGSGKIAYTSAGTGVGASLLTAGTNFATVNPSDALGWTIIGTQGISTQGARSMWAWKIATSASETAPTFRNSGSDEWRTAIYVVENFNATTPVDGWQRKEWGDSLSIAQADSNSSIGASSNGGSALSATGDSLLFYSFVSDNGSINIFRPDSTSFVCDIVKANDSGVAHVVGHRQHGSTTGTVHNAEFSCSVRNEGGQIWVISIADDGNKKLTPHVDIDMTHINYFGQIGQYEKQATVTFTIATSLVTYTAPTTDQWENGMAVWFSATSSPTYPTGINGTTVYYIRDLDETANTFKLETAPGAGAITMSGTQSGTFYCYQTFAKPSVLTTDTIDGVGLATGDVTVPIGTTSSFATTPWNGGSNIQNTDNTTGAWSGGSWQFKTAIDMTDAFVTLQFTTGFSNASSYVSTKGAIMMFVDSSGNWVAYKILERALFNSAVQWDVIIALGYATVFANSAGAIDWSDIKKYGIMFHRGNSTANASTFSIRGFDIIRKVTVRGGASTVPANFTDIHTVLTSWDDSARVAKSGMAQVVAKTPVQIGNGTDRTYFDASGGSLEFPLDFLSTNRIRREWNVDDNRAGITIYASTNDTIKLPAEVIATDTPQQIDVHASSSTSATYDVAGASIIGFKYTDNAGINVSSATFQDGSTATFKGNVTNCTIKDTDGAVPACAETGNSKTITDTTIDVTGTSATYHLELGTAVDAITLADVTFTGTSSTGDKIHVLKTTGTVTITISGTTNLLSDASEITSAGASVSVVAPTDDIEFTGLVAGSQVKVFTSGTTTELFSTDSSGTSETTGAITVPATIDYTIMKAGYIPIRVTGVSMTTSLSFPISQVVDRAYVASTDLVFTTNATANTSTKIFAINTATTVQNWYSFMIESWIAQSSLKNVAFPLAVNGPNSVSLGLDWEWRGWASSQTQGTGIANTSLALLSRDGMRYVSTAGTQTAVWVAILSAGVPTGKQVTYQQTDGGTTVNAQNTGNIDQLIQVYGNASYGNFDYRTWLTLKVQEDGYDQAEVNLMDTYTSLEDQLYQVALFPLSNGLTTGDPSVTGVTITDHAGSPVTWNGKDFSITITDSAGGHTGEEIMRWLRYNYSLGGTFQSKDTFNWHDLVQTNGTAYKTVRGAIYGDTGATLKGVRVVQSDGTTAHPDFTLFTADNGTTYTPPATHTINLSGFASGTRIQIYDTLNSTQLFLGVVSATTKVYTETRTVDRNIRIRAALLGKMFVDMNIGSLTASNLTLTRDLEQVDNDVYNTNGVDGSTITGMTIDDAGLQFEFSSGTIVTYGTTDVLRINVKDIYAYEEYWLTTDAGIIDDGKYITAIDTANYQVFNTKFLNATVAPAYPINIIGGYVVDGDTGVFASAVDYSGTESINNAPDHVAPIIVNTTGTPVVTGDITEIPGYVQSGLTAQGLTTTRAGKLDNLDMSIIASTQA